VTLDPGKRLAIEREQLGVAGRLAAAFIDSKLTPLFVLFALALGALAVIVTPREEEPQIKVPMIDVFTALPGRGPVEVERQIVAPLEKSLWSIPGVEYVYSTSSPGRALVIVRFRVGEDPDRALVRVRAKIDALSGEWPPDVPPPLVKARSIDDVPVWAMTFWSPAQDSATLRQIAAEVENEIKTIPDVSDTALIGGLKREFRVELDPARLSARSQRRTGGWPRARSSRAIARSRSKPAASSAARTSSAPSWSPAAAAGRSIWPTSRGWWTGPRSRRRT
jgi:Cu/Ag efflux pump CusA